MLADDDERRPGAPPAPGGLRAMGGGGGQLDQGGTRHAPAAVAEKSRLTVAGDVLFDAEPGGGAKWSWRGGATGALPRALRRLAERFTVVVILPGCSCDADEDAATRVLGLAGFELPCPASASAQLHLVSCEQLESVAHVARRLAPLVHIDHNHAAVQALRQHLPLVVHAGNAGSLGRGDDGVHRIGVLDPAAAGAILKIV